MQLIYIIYSELYLNLILLFKFFISFFHSDLSFLSLFKNSLRRHSHFESIINWSFERIKFNRSIYYILSSLFIYCIVVCFFFPLCLHFPSLAVCFPLNFFLFLYPSHYFSGITFNISHFHLPWRQFFPKKI